MPSTTEPTPARIGIMARLRRYFLTGLVVTAPVLLTVYIVWGTITWIDGVVTPFIPRQYLPEAHLPFKIPGVGLVVVLIGLTVMGWVSAGYVGRRLVRFGESIVARMPVVRGLYSAMKQVFVTLFTQSSNSFRQVVLIQFPRHGVWSLGFVTGTTSGEVARRTGNGEAMVNVFVPTTPNPTSGFLMFVPPGELVHLDMSVEDGLKMLVSIGLVTPVEMAPPVPRPGAS